MSRISFRHRDDATTYIARDRMTPERAAQMAPGEVSSRLTRYFPAEGESLNFFQVDIEPNGEVRPHAHTAAEVVYVLRGELHFGSRVAREGDAVFVDEYTLYGFVAGPDGASFLNFRGVPEVGFLTKDELLAHRAGETVTPTPATRA